MPSITVSGPEFSIVRKTITSAQILAIHTTPVTIVAAPGTGRTIIPMWVLAEYVFVTTAYTDGGGNLEFNVASNLSVSMGATAGFWDQNQGRRKLYPLPAIVNDTTSATTNQPLTITNTVANPTLGDGTMVVTAAYYVATV